MYKGFWSSKNRSQISTFGEIVFPDERIYRGQVNPKIGMDGKGTMIFKDQSVYVGNFKNNTFSGFGVFFDNQQKSIYKGEWLENQQHGEGIEIWKNTKIKRYIGDFNQGEKTGKGRLEMKDGSYIEGNFINGLM